MRRIGSVVISAIIFMLVAMFIPGVSVDSFWTAVWATILLTVLNATIGLVLRIITFPVNFITLGLVNILINGFVMILVGNLVDGLEISSLFVGIILVAVFSTINTLVGQN